LGLLRKKKHVVDGHKNGVEKVPPLPVLGGPAEPEEERKAVCKNCLRKERHELKEDPATQKKMIPSPKNFRCSAW